jgi:hypothetical protein
LLDRLNDGHSLSELQDLGVDKLKDLVFSLILGKLSQLSQLIISIILHVINAEGLKLDVLVIKPLLIPLFLQVPDFSEVLDLLLNLSDLRIRLWINIEDVQSESESLLISSELNAGAFVLLELLEGSVILSHSVGFFIDGHWSSLLEVVSGVNAEFLELFDGGVNLLLVVLGVLSDVGFSLFKTILESLEVLIQLVFLLLVFLGEVVGGDHILLLGNVLELKLDGISLLVVNRDFLLDILKQLLVVLQKLEGVGRLLKSGDDLVPVLNQIVEVFLGLTNQVLVDGLSVQVNSISK